MGLGGYLSVLSESPGALRSALNESGWIDQEVVAAGQLRQGKAPTTLGMITGHALVEVTALHGRLLCCGQVGADVAVISVSPDTAATPREGELDGDVRVAIAGGVLTAWRARRSWQADGDSLDALAAKVPGILERRGIATG